ncbi:MAG: dATP pyrophosphohydrolase [Robiginitomaculum sp.]|nr:MAG: dATP pyrophosphohydrolase [Robiginitomaculum sp.]
MNADLVIDPVIDKAGLKEFIQLPNQIYGEDPNWIPALDMERMGILDPKQSPYFEHAEAQYWIARQNGKAVGRISAQIDQMSLEANDSTTGHFGMIVAIDDPAVIKALLETAENWLKERGMKTAQGPFNLSINQEVGLLIDGRNTPPMMLMAHDPAYMGGHIEAAGYAKAKDLLAYIRGTDFLFPEKWRRMAERRSSHVTMRMFDMKNYNRDIKHIVSIFNEAWHNNWNFVPMTEKEVDHMAKELRPLIRKELAWFADIDGEPAAFIVCLPDVNGAIGDLKGKLLPFGWLKLLWRLKVKRPATARVLLMGVRRKFSDGILGQILPFRLIYALESDLYESPIKQVEMSWILEDNAPVKRMIETLGGKAYKTYRVYKKAL